MDASTNPIEERPRVDSFVVADWAEAVNGKLYLMGGGFDTVFAASFPFMHRFAFGAILRVPWNDTNRRLPIEAVLETEQREEVALMVRGELETGRPAGARRGAATNIVFVGPVHLALEEEPEQMPFPLNLRLSFANDERTLPLKIERAPFQTPPGVQSPPS